MHDPYATLADQLDQLVDELQRLGLWSEQPPSAEALASTAPFCYDTLAFHQWLQWVFVPQLRQLVALRAPLPGNCAIAAMAEPAFAEADWDSGPLIALLKAIDDSFNSSGGRLQ